MKRRLFILAQADEELAEQVAWYHSVAGSRVAMRFYDEWKRALRSLQMRPGRGRFVLTARDELRGLRAKLMRRFPFHVYYREVPGGIEIVHLLHGARSVDRWI